MRLNLAIHDRTRSLTLPLWALAATVAVLTLGWMATVQHQVSMLRQRVEAQRGIVTQLRAEAARADAAAAPYRTAAMLEAQLHTDAVAPQVLRDIEPAIPTDVWFAGVTLGHGTITINGHSLTVPAITRAVAALRDDPSIASALVAVVTKDKQGWYTFTLTAVPRGASGASSAPGTGVPSNPEHQIPAAPAEPVR